MNTPLFFSSRPTLWPTLALILCAAIASVLPVSFAHAEDSTPTVNIIGAGGNVRKLAFATPMGNTSRADALQQDLARNLAIVPFISLVNPQGIPGGPGVTSPTGQGIDFKKFLLAGVHLLITTNWVDGGNVEIRAFDVADGRFLFGNRYAVQADGTPGVADKFCGDLLEALIGRGDFFRASLAFIKSSAQYKKDVWTVKPNGRNLTQRTNIPGESLSPSWSSDGRFIIFSNIEPRSHGLGVHDVNSKTTQRIKFPGNTVIGPTFLPDNRVAVSLTDGRNPSIFLLSHTFQKERPLESSSAIDVSPSIDATGSKMAFTSSRLGNPQVFLKDLRGGGVRRISQQGSYNTDPSISPDGTLVAYARRTDGGHRIFVYDLVNNSDRQVSFGPGNDESPAFAPDSYFIAFTTTRAGGKKIFLTTRGGGNAVLLPTGPGDAAFPAWSPGPKQQQ